MHANELIKTLVTKLHHHTEGERDELLAAVDVAFPVAEPEPDAADDDGQEQPDTGTPGVTAKPKGA
jgi:hypothetical protein